MATQNSSGIQTLLAAEQEASKKVALARQYRLQRVKDAKADATKEIETLKAQKLEEFQKYEKEHSGTYNEAMTKVNAETEDSLKKVQEAFAANKEKVIQRLLQTIVEVKPVVHANATLQAAA